MNTVLFLKTFALGLSIAAPVGPIGLLCIQQTLRGGVWCGFIAGLGAATADACYGALAAFGLAAASKVLLDHRRLLALGGGFFLIYLGARTLRREKESSREEQQTTIPLRGAFRIWASTCFLTLANPMTILSFTAVFSSLAGESMWTAGNAPLVMVSGFFTGSLAWWFFLSGMVSLLRKAVSSRTMHAISRISGVIILLFGAYALATAVIE